MLTKKHARSFRERVDRGEFPTGLPYSRGIGWVLKQSAYDLKKWIRSTDFYGCPWMRGLVKRAIEMGLFDKDYNLTELGLRYK